jgi:branched-chain amino acid transport system ATP-binding protein
MSHVLLDVKNLHVAYGGIQAVKGVDLTLHRDEIVALIGANGAGKTTMMKAICGLKAWSKGEIVYQGKSIRQAPTCKLLQRGLAMVPEGRGIFTRMSVMENLLMGAYCRHDEEGIQQDIEKMFDFFPRLKERSKQLAGTLSGGEQQMLAIARALLRGPALKVLLLDEPSMGLSPIMRERIFEVIPKIHARGTAMLIVEQNAHLALQAAHRGYVMESGKISMSGRASQLLDDPKIHEAYLGG